MAIQVISLVVLARLLAPADFGVYAMAMTFIGFTALFRDLGLSAAAVQAKELSTQARSNLWWINAGVGAALTVAALLAAPAIAGFFREPAVALVVMLMAPTLFLAGAAAQYTASLMRSLRFGTLAVIDVSGALLGLMVAIAVAVNGGGVWALVMPQLVAGMVSLVASLAVCRWLPGLPRRGHGTRALATFGGALFVTQILTYVHRNADSLLMGRLHGAVWTGMFNRAQQLTRMPVGMLATPFSRVALATMAPAQDDNDALRRLALKGQLMLALPILLTGAGLIAAAAPLVELVLGPGWDRAVPFVQLIAASETLALMASVGGWILSAKGLGRMLIRLSVLSTMVKISLIALGALWGPYGIVAGAVAAQLILWPASLLLAGRFSGVNTRKILANSYRLVAMAAVTGAVGFLATQLSLGQGIPVVQVAAAAVAMALTLGAMSLVVPPVRRDIGTFLVTARSGLR